MTKYQGSTLTEEKHPGKYRRVMSASTLSGDKVVNRTGEDLGKIDEIMIDTKSGCVGYAVLSLEGLLGMGEELFAILWSRMFFDKENWPDMTDAAWGTDIHRYYGVPPYWE